MRLVFLTNIQDNEVLAKDVLDNNGIPLLTAGTEMSHSYITSLKRKGILFVYVKDDDLSDIKEDIKLKEAKQHAIETLPEAFNCIASKDYMATSKLIESIDVLVNYIEEQDNINTSLYEVMLYDDYTYIHSIDTAMMAIFLGKKLGLEGKELRELGISALLHDIGKTQIPHEIISKKSKLSDEEFELIKEHPTLGKKILEEAQCFSHKILAGVAHHHERYDGSGYPYGLRGKYISEFGRIISICDVFTAVTANRSYRSRYEPNEAYELMLSGSGTLFDPKIIEVFKRYVFIYPLGSCVRLSNSQEGYIVKQNPDFPDKPIVRILFDGKEDTESKPYEIDLSKSTNIIITSIVTGKDDELIAQ
ncbi:HD-GYP domain-containing protein [Clostridium cellulovorans]|uniref:Metal dependent phosphohydrolase n=1 Tax=Clostridium cellulovorans (strain ATCC 35296 / DSM 3052 / OCM 3 / 743B) TaxID=573061 RepID=D9SPB2_CLOC7|nr:HD-GYP domain-containing protein [Clostridium cellulovorans]ADL54014.1 metal dependent phosphohydrolase [Clostridium cellulovorans 743B]